VNGAVAKHPGAEPEREDPSRYSDARPGLARVPPLSENDVVLNAGSDAGLLGSD